MDEEKGLMLPEEYPQSVLDFYETDAAKPFRDHSQGIDIIDWLVSMQGEIGGEPDKKIGWTEASRIIEMEFGFQIQPEKIRRLLCGKLGLAIVSNSEWHARSVLEAGVNLKKVAEANRIADRMVKVFDDSVDNVGKVEVDENGKIKRIGPTHKEIGTLGKDVFTVLKGTNELNAALNMGVKVEKAPMVALQQNFSGSMAEFAGVETPRRAPKQADVVDAERAD